MKLKDFNFIFHTIEDEIKEGVELVEGVEPTIAELLEYHLKENDENFLTWIFEDYDEERGDINSLDDLTENEAEQVNKLIQYCKDTYHVLIDDCDMSTKWMAGGMTFEEAKDYVDGLTPDEYEGYEGGVAIVYSDITENEVYHIDLPEKQEEPWAEAKRAELYDCEDPRFDIEYSNGVSEIIRLFDYRDGNTRYLDNHKLADHIFDMSDFVEHADAWELADKIIEMFEETTYTDIADYEDNECCVVSTNKGKALVGFDTYQDAEDKAFKCQGSVVKLRRRDGHRAYDVIDDSADNGFCMPDDLGENNYCCAFYTAADAIESIEDEMKELARELEDEDIEQSEYDDYLSTMQEAIEAINKEFVDGSKVFVLYEGWNYDILDKYVPHFREDVYEYIIGVML